MSAIYADLKELVNDLLQQTKDARDDIIQRALAEFEKVWNWRLSQGCRLWLDRWFSLLSSRIPRRTVVLVVQAVPKT